MPAPRPRSTTAIMSSATTAEFERAMMLERQRQGIASAKMRGNTLAGRPPVGRQAAKIRQMARAGYDKEGHR